MQPHQAYRVDSLAKVLRIPVFPPANPCFIGEPNAADVGAYMCIAGEILFEITPHPHIAISDGGKAFGKANGTPVKTFFNHLPGMNFICHTYTSPYAQTFAILII